MKSFHFVPALFFFVVSFGLNAQSTIESIPNQKLINGSYVSNPNNILDATTVGQIDSLLKGLEEKTTVQVAVVVVESIGQDDVFDFAQRLFVKWGIGNKENDNGLLLLFVNDQRTVRFHTGNGLEGVLPDVICVRIQRDYMVPEFKNGNFNGGMLAGIQQVAKVLTDPKYSEELTKPEGEPVSAWTGFITFLVIFIMPVFLIFYFVRTRQGTFRDSKSPSETPYPEMRLSKFGFLLQFLFIPAAIVTVCAFTTDNVTGPSLCAFILYLYYLATRFQRLQRTQKVINRFLATEEYYQIVEFIRKQQWYWLAMGILFPLPFLPYFFYHLSRKRLYRNHPRKCKQCSNQMRKLSEAEEDEYLSESQQLEETIKSVDYDVWKCTSCETIEMSFYLTNQSKFTVCPKCETIAFYSASSRTLTHATYSSTGKGEDTSVCKFCGHKKVTTFTIPKRERSTSSSSSSFGSSSSSSSGSWGGGSSGGGGASSKW